MAGFIFAIALGIVCILIGLSNRKGNIETLHSYHRSRVSEEDRIPFGKEVGNGMIVIGCAVSVYGILSIITLCTDNDIFTLAGCGIMILGLVIGLVITFRAMIKYNKGIF